MRAASQSTVRRLLMSALLWLAACVPTSEHPIKVAGQGPDQDLVGAWHGALDDGGLIDMYFLKRQNQDSYSAVLITRGANTQDHGEWAVFSVETAEVKGTHYLSALWDYNDGEAVTGRDRGYHLLRYDIAADGTLSMFTINERRLERAVKAHKVEGTVEAVRNNPDVRLTASPEALAAFLAKTRPKKLFDHPFATVKRMP